MEDENFAGAIDTVDERYRPYFRFALDLARKSGEVILPYFRRPGLAVERKRDDSPVTRADTQAEEVMRDAIRARFPEHGVIGEEFGSEGAERELVWVLDPIDGTVSFASGCPLFGTLVALLHRGTPVLGLIYQPVLDQLCIGTGSHTFLNGRPVRMRDAPDLSLATLLTTDLANIEAYQSMERFEVLRRKAAIFRTWGDCYGYLLAATGWADIMIDPLMNPWDILPVIPVIEGAGGRISGWRGESALTADSCVAAHPALHDEVLSILNDQDSHRAGQP